MFAIGLFACIIMLQRDIAGHVFAVNVHIFPIFAAHLQTVWSMFGVCLGYVWGMLGITKDLPDRASSHASDAAP